jgi:hypothetical protein
VCACEVLGVLGRLEQRDGAAGARMGRPSVSDRRAIDQ